MVRKGLLHFFIAFAAIVAFSVTAGRWYLLRTEYAPGFTTTGFVQIQMGDRWDKVLSILNAPIDFVVMEMNANSPNEPVHFTDASAISRWNNDSSAMLILHYSVPRVTGSHFYVYEVWLRGGTVQETRAYTYWD